MAKSFRFPRWVEKTRTYSIHPVAFIDQPVATPHQPRYAQQLPPGGSQGGCAARVAKLATPTELKKFLAYSNQRTTPPQSDLSIPKCRQIRQLFNHGMIVPGNHNFERFAALCNTPEVEPRRLRRSGSPGWRPLQWLCYAGSVLYHHPRFGVQFRHRAG